jgi:hypothetical protein
MTAQIWLGDGQGYEASFPKCTEFIILMFAEVGQSSKYRRCVSQVKYEHKVITNDIRTNKIQYQVKVKGKVVPAHAMKAYWGYRGTAPLILNLGARYR